MDVGTEIVITAGIATAAVLVATWQGWMMRRSEQLRTQPIVVVAEQAHPKPGSQDSGPSVELFLRNDGAGSAFAVTFGILEKEMRHRCPAPESGPASPGALPRVLASGTRAPAGSGFFHYELPFDPYVDGELSERVYWCRFRNAFGHEWETRNSSAEEKRLEIERIGGLRRGRSGRLSG